MRLIEHLLLLEHSPAEAPRRGWIDEVANCRREIDLRLSASLRRDLARQLPALYDYARRYLRSRLEPYGEAGIIADLPAQCPTASTRSSATSGQLDATEQSHEQKAFLPACLRQSVSNRPLPGSAPIAVSLTSAAIGARDENGRPELRPHG